MHLISGLLITLIIGIVFSGIKKEVFNAEKSMDDRNFVVRQSRAVLWVGIVAMLFFGALTVLMAAFPNDTAEPPIYLMFAIFFFLGFFVALHSIFLEVRIEGDEIYYKSLFRSQKKTTFSEISKVRIKDASLTHRSIVLYVGARRFLSVESFCRGSNVLVERLKKEKNRI